MPRHLAIKTNKTYKKQGFFEWNEFCLSDVYQKTSENKIGFADFIKFARKEISSFRTRCILEIRNDWNSSRIFKTESLIIPERRWLDKIEPKIILSDKFILGEKL